MPWEKAKPMRILVCWNSSLNISKTFIKKKRKKGEKKKGSSVATCQEVTLQGLQLNRPNDIYVFKWLPVKI